MDSVVIAVFVGGLILGEVLKPISKLLKLAGKN